MKFQKSAIELMQTRTSSRTYDGNQIDSELLRKLNETIDSINQEASIKVKFLIAGKGDSNSNDNKKMGTYGVISGATTFIIGLLDKSETDAVEFGYLFEKIILTATDLGLQTCWLGGTFNRNDFVEKANVGENEIIAIISPVGIKNAKSKIVEKAMRAVAGSDHRKSWNELFFNGDSSNPLTKEEAGDYSVPLEMVRLAPSASNKQPWRIIKTSYGYDFFLSRTKGYGALGFDMQKNDLGIAKCHFELATEELHLNGQWIILNNIDVPNEWEYIVTWHID